MGTYIQVHTDIKADNLVHSEKRSVRKGGRPNSAIESIAAAISPEKFDDDIESIIR